MRDYLNSVDEARPKLGGLCRTRLYDLIRTGELQTVKIGRRRFVPESAIQAYIESLKVSA